jgi:hypothetical protein
VRTPDDLTSEEMKPENAELIIVLHHLSRGPVSVSPIQQAQLLARVRERLFRNEHSIVDKQQSAPLIHLSHSLQQEEDQHVSSRSDEEVSGLPIGRTGTSLSQHGYTRGTISRKMHVLHIANLIAAILVVTVIISASLFLFHQHSPISGNGSISNATAAPNIEQNCRLGIDEGLNYVCSHHLYQDIHLSKNIGKFTLIIEQAYADANRIALGYIVRTEKGDITQDTRLQMSLITLQGLSFSDIVGNAIVIGNNGTALFYPEHEIGNSKRLNLRLNVLSLSASVSTTFDFSVLFHPEQRVLDIHQTAMANGIRMTLERGIISLSQTSFFFTFEPNLPPSRLSIGSPEFSFNGKRCGTEDGSGNSKTYRLYVPCPLLDGQGTWMIHITAFGNPKDYRGKTPDAWVFHFYVP